MLDPIPVQRLEGVALLVAAVTAFDASGWSWWWFAGAPSGALVGGSIWLAHIGMDRALGYGLKLRDGF